MHVSCDGKTSLELMCLPAPAAAADEFIMDLPRVSAGAYAPVEVAASRIDAIMRHGRWLRQIRVPTTAPGGRRPNLGGHVTLTGPSRPAACRSCLPIH